MAVKAVYNWYYISKPVKLLISRKLLESHTHSAITPSVYYERVYCKCRAHSTSQHSVSTGTCQTSRFILHSSDSLYQSKYCNVRLSNRSMKVLSPYLGNPVCCRNVAELDYALLDCLSYVVSPDVDVIESSVMGRLIC